MSAYEPGAIVSATVSNGEQVRAMRTGVPSNMGWEISRPSSRLWLSDDNQGGGLTDIRPVVVIDPEDREQVERLRDLCDAALRDQAEGPLLFPSSKGERGNALQAALRSLVTPKCEAILNVKGQHVDCDRGEGHSLPHGNVEHGAIWQGVGA